MITNCLICNSSLTKQDVTKEYAADGWAKKFPTETEPSTFDYFKCMHCFENTEDYFGVSYLGGHLWCINIEESPGIYVLNNYIGDRCLVNSMDIDSIKKSNDIKINHALNLDLTDLEKIREQLQAYVIFC